MNERIIELNREAQAFATRIWGDDEDYFNQWVETYKEKLAELIVRDCALTAGLMEHEGRNGIGAQLLDNFGVEE